MSRPLRVAHVTTTGRIGGAERVIIDVVRAAASHDGQATDIFVLSNVAEMKAALRGTPVNVTDLDVRHTLGASRALFRLTRGLRHSRPDVVHTHLLHAGLLGALAARIARVPLVVATRHYGNFLWQFGSRSDRLIQRIGDRLTDHVFAVSAAVGAAVLEFDRVPADRLSVVPNGIDPSRLSQETAEDPQIEQPHHQRVGTVGALQPWKGNVTLLEAFRRIHDGRMQLVLIGDGPEEAALRRLAKQYQIEDHVAFKGRMLNPYPVVAGMDVYVQPSISEGFGLATLEAMFLARPVVVSRSGGLPELVESGRSGVIVPPGDSRALATAIQTLLGNNEMRRRFGEAARERALAYFTAARAAAAYDDAYRSLLATRGVLA